MPSEEAEKRVGEIVGEHRLLSVLGEGGMGVVYKAEHTWIGKQVALKMLLPEYSHRADVVQRFVTEAIAVNKIAHRNIIDIFSFGKTPDNTPFFVMELLKGTELANELERSGALSLARALNVIRQVADALSASHKAGILHRDLKPENIFLVPPVGKEPELVKVLDFGIAKLLEQNSSQPQTKTKTGAIIGTPQYMAPEQIRQQPVDARTDLYALGLVFYEIVTGVPPFVAPTFPDLVVKMLTQPLPPPREKNPQLPEAIESVILKMLAIDPAKRYQSINEFLAALDIAEANTQGATPSGAVPSVKALELLAPKTNNTEPTRLKNPTTLSLSATEAPAKDQKSRPGLFIAAAALLLVGAGSLYTISSPQNIATPSQAAPILEVQIELNSVPAGATVSLSDQVLGQTPLQWKIPSSQTQLTVTLEKSGFHTKTKTLVPNNNISLEILLEPLPTTAPTSLAAPDPKSVAEPPPKTKTNSKVKTPKPTDPPKTGELAPM